MLGEHLVIGARLCEIGLGSEQLQTNRHRVKTADEKEEADPAQIEQGDALVIFRQQPRLHAVFSVEVIGTWRFWYFEFFHVVSINSIVPV